MKRQVNRKSVKKNATMNNDNFRGIDLFEDYENIPPRINAIVERYQDLYGEDLEGMDYKDTARMLDEFEQQGYTFGYGLDNQPYGLRPIGVRLNQLKGYEEYGDDEYGNGGETPMARNGMKTETIGASGSKYKVELWKSFEDMREGEKPYKIVYSLNEKEIRDLAEENDGASKLYQKRKGKYNNFSTYLEKGGQCMYGLGGRVDDIDSEVSTNGLKEELREKMKDGDDVIHFAYTDYGGDFVDKVAIEYFEENYPNNIVSEDTYYSGKNAFVFGTPATEWIEASANYLLGFEDFESYYYQRQTEVEYEGFNDFLKDLRMRYAFNKEKVLDWLMNNKTGTYSVDTQGLDFSYGDLVEELENEGLIKKSKEYGGGGETPMAREGMKVKNWSASDVSNAEYLGVIEFEDTDGEFHNFEIMETEDRLVFGGMTNSGFIESGYIEKDGRSTDETLRNLLEDLEVYYNDGVEYTSEIVVNQRMANGGTFGGGGKIKAVRDEDNDYYVYGDSFDYEGDDDYKNYDDYKTKMYVINIYNESGDFIKKLTAESEEEAQEMINEINSTQKYGGGGSIEEGNYHMILSQAKEVQHHVDELQDILKKEDDIEAWVVAKMQDVSSTLSDVTHYLDGKSDMPMAREGMKLDDFLKKEYVKMKGGLDYYSVDIDLQEEQIRDIETKSLDRAKKVFDEYSKSMEYDGEKIDNVQLVAVFKNGDYETLYSKFYEFDADEMGKGGKTPMAKRGMKVKEMAKNVINPFSFGTQEYWDRRENFERFLNFTDDSIYWMWLNEEISDRQANAMIQDKHNISFNPTIEYAKGGKTPMAREGMKVDKIEYPTITLKEYDLNDDQTEIFAYIESRQEMQKQYDTIRKNLMTKIARGEFDETKAPKLFMYLVENGLKLYSKNFSEIKLSKQEKEEIANNMVVEFMNEAELGNYENETFLPKKYLAGDGMFVMTYDIYNEDGDCVANGVTADMIVDYANLQWYYDMMDEDGEEIDDVDVAIDYLEQDGHNIERHNPEKSSSATKKRKIIRKMKK